MFHKLAVRSLHDESRITEPLQLDPLHECNLYPPSTPCFIILCVYNDVNAASSKTSFSIVPNTMDNTPYNIQVLNK
jgi:hypothetical protein